LSRFFELSEGFWLGLQSDFDLEEQRLLVANQLKRIKCFPSIKNILKNKIRNKK